MSKALAGESRQRARNAGLTPGILTPGPCNALTDVSGVLGGHRTLIQEPYNRTGATAILDWTLSQPGARTTRSIYPVVGETNDGFSAIEKRVLTSWQVLEAIVSAPSDLRSKGRRVSDFGNGQRVRLPLVSSVHRGDRRGHYQLAAHGREDDWARQHSGRSFALGTRAADSAIAWCDSNIVEGMMR